MLELLEKEETEKLLSHLKSGWKIVDGKTLLKDFTFPDFKEAIKFVDKVAQIAEVQQHHPNINLHDYKQVTIELMTHKIHGLSEKDFILAAKIETLM